MSISYDRHYNNKAFLLMTEHYEMKQSDFYNRFTLEKKS